MLLTGATTGQVDFASGSVVERGGHDAFVSSFRLANNLPDADREARFEQGQQDPAPTRPPGSSASGWTRSLGGPGFAGVRALELDGVGDIVIAGTFVEALRWGDETVKGFGKADVFVGKLDASGAPAWVHVFADGEVQTDPTLAVSTSGTVLLSFETRPYGRPLSQINDPTHRVIVAFSGTGEEQWRTVLPSRHPIVLASVDGSGFWGLFQFARVPTVVSWNEKGEVLWEQTIEGGLANVHDAAPDGSGGLFISGGPSTADSYVARLDARGQVAWNTSLGSLDPRTRLRVASGSGGQVLALSSEGTVYALDTSGNLLWRSTWTGTVQANDIQFLRDGSGFVVVGGFEGEAKFGALGLHSLGGRDVFVIAMGADGLVRSAQRFGGLAADEAVAVATAEGARVIVSGTAWRATDFIGSEGVGLRRDGVFVTSFSTR